MQASSYIVNFRIMNQKDMNIIVKRAIYILSILLIVFGTFYVYLPPSNGAIDYIEESVGKGRVDVACIGSSHVYTGINPIQMYEDKGIAAYDIARGSQAPWQSYYYIKAVCKSQNPDLIILDVYTFSKGDISDFNEGRAVKNLIDYPFSLDKWRALVESDVASPLSVMLVFPYSYDEYDKAFQDGFKLNKKKSAVGYNLGYSYRTGIEEYDVSVDGRTITASKPIHSKIEKYLRKAIEFCRDNNTAILLTNTPCPVITEERYEYFNYIQSIADEYGVTFINGCLYEDEMGIDWKKDSYGEGHLNYDGVTKYTAWLGNYLDERYELPDRRGEAGYEIYDLAVKKLNEKLDAASQSAEDVKGLTGDER